MIATVVNALAILLGGLIGLILKSKLKKEMCEALLRTIGIVVIIIGLSGALKSMFVIEQEILKTQFELLLLICLSLGALLGTLLKIDGNITKFGNYVEVKLNKGAFSEGFVTSTLIFCVGAMSIFGSVQAAVGDYNVLFLKSAIDGVAAMLLASTLGFGVLFSAISVLIYQGAFTIIALFATDFLTETEFLNAFCLVGYVIVMCIGINFLFDHLNNYKKIKIADMLPSLLLVIIYFIFKNLIGF